MNLLADENIDRLIVDRLRHEGHDVIYVAELSPSISDDDVLREANSHGCLLLTADKDFGDLVYRLGRVHHGVLLIRLAGLPLSVKADTVAQALQAHAQQLAGAFTVISPGVVRIRKPPAGSP